MRFGQFISQQLKFAFSSSLAIGLVVALAILITGGAEGSITLDIDLSYSDAAWLLLGIPVAITSLFLFISPLSFLIHSAVSRWK